MYDLIATRRFVIVRIIKKTKTYTLQDLFNVHIGQVVYI